jgi:hypothetical protein
MEANNTNKEGFRNAHSTVKFPVGKNKQIFKTLGRKCHGEFRAFLNVVSWHMYKKKAGLLLLPSRTYVAQMIHSSKGHIWVL